MPAEVLAALSVAVHDVLYDQQGRPPAYDDAGGHETRSPNSQLPNSRLLCKPWKGSSSGSRQPLVRRRTCRDSADDSVAAGPEVNRENRSHCRRSGAILLARITLGSDWTFSLCERRLRT